MECRFDSEIEDGDGDKSSPQRNSQDIQATLASGGGSQVASFSFVRDCDGESGARGPRECIFDLKTEQILLGLEQMVEERISVVRKSPYFQH